VVQCVTACYSVLQRVAVCCCSVLQCLHCARKWWDGMSPPIFDCRSVVQSVQCVAVHNSALQCVALRMSHVAHRNESCRT